jgi:hypothetical protein
MMWDIPMMTSTVTSTMSDEERATDVSDTTDGSDAYVCEGWDEPNYISADHAYYPDLSELQSDVEPPTDG